MVSQISITEQAGVKILNLGGEFTGGNETNDLRSAFQNLSALNSDKAIINFEKVTYLNSTALGILISANADFKERGSKLAFVNLDKTIKNLFYVTKLNIVFPISENIEEAIKLISE